MDQRALQELLEKQEISELIHRYSRSLDRGDWQGLASVFHPDAILPSHMDAAVIHKDAAEFVQWMREFHAPCDRIISQLSNIAIELRGNKAGAETYVKSAQRRKRPDGKVDLTVVTGRYIDEFEKRAGRWAISARTFVCEFLENSLIQEQFPPELTPSKRSPEDPSYRVIDRTKTN